VRQEADCGMCNVAVVVLVLGEGGYQTVVVES